MKKQKWITVKYTDLETGEAKQLTAPMCGCPSCGQSRCVKKLRCVAVNAAIKSGSFEVFTA